MASSDCLWLFSSTLCYHEGKKIVFHYEGSVPKNHYFSQQLILNQLQLLSQVLRYFLIKLTKIRLIWTQ